MYLPLIAATRSWSRALSFLAPRKPRPIELASSSRINTRFITPLRSGAPWSFAFAACDRQSLRPCRDTFVTHGYISRYVQTQLVLSMHFIGQHRGLQKGAMTTPPCSLTGVFQLDHAAYSVPETWCLYQERRYSRALLLASGDQCQIWYMFVNTATWLG